jgi:hypothetical protein
MYILHTNGGHVYTLTYVHIGYIYIYISWFPITYNSLSFHIIVTGSVWLVRDMKAYRESGI